MTRRTWIGVTCAVLASTSILGLFTQSRMPPREKLPVGYVITSKGEWRNSLGARLAVGQSIFEGDLINVSHHSEPDAFIELYLLSGETLSRECSAAACTTPLEVRKSDKPSITSWYRGLIPLIWPNEQILSIAVYAMLSDEPEQSPASERWGIV